MTRKILTLALAVFGSFVAFQTVQAQVITVDTDTTWTGEVVVDNGEGVVITNGATLTIASEAVVKMGADDSIIITGGNLAMAGEVGKPAVITALTATSAPGDWGYILVSSASSSITMDHARVEFGGGGSLSIPAYIMVQQADSILIENSELVNNNGSILIYEIGSFSIHNSNIYNPDFCQDMGGVPFCGSSILNLSSTEMNATENYWGSDEGPTTDPAGDLKGTIIQGSVSYIPFLTTAYEEPEVPDDPEEPKCKKHWWLKYCHHKHKKCKFMKGPWGFHEWGKVTIPDGFDWDERKEKWKEKFGNKFKKPCKKFKSKKCPWGKKK